MLFKDYLKWCIIGVINKDGFVILLVIIIWVFVFRVGNIVFILR